MVNNRTPAYINALFISLILAYTILGFYLIWHIPYSFPFGGPDELMHLSMADYISRHLEWPQWDSQEVVRNAYGVSYSAGGSIIYWLHGLSYKLFGHHRIGAFILLLLYLGLSVWIYRKSVLAGFLLLAGLLPQTLFIFSYVNSDAGTVVSALLMGMGTALFVTGENRVRNMLIFFFFAGLAVTARQHLWAIAFLTFVWAIVYKRHTWLQYEKKYWLYALLLALLPASWWFVTSYLSNAGDILGVFTNAKSIAKFGNPDLPSLARAWNDISVSDFLDATLISLYANWGWMSLALDKYAYYSVSVVSLLIVALLYTKIDKRLFFFFVLLIAANFGFMLLYSTYYDYQAQGRYLFPSFYIVLGMIAMIMVTQKIFSKALLTLLVILSLQNIYYSTKLTLFSYVDIFLEKPVLWDAHPKQYYKDVVFHIDQLQIIDGKLMIRGWAFDKRTGRAFSQLSLVLKGKDTLYRVRLQQEERPDVASAFKSDALNMSGFAARMVDLRGLPKGTYHYLLSPVVDGEPVLIEIGGTLKR
jgi:hypothetical protein